MYRYYLTQRGPGPGCQPSGASWSNDFGIKKYVDATKCNVWGWVEYKEPLTEKKISDYELVEEE